MKTDKITVLKVLESKSDAINRLADYMMGLEGPYGEYYDEGFIPVLKEDEALYMAFKTVLWLELNPVDIEYEDMSEREVKERIRKEYINRQADSL